MKFRKSKTTYEDIELTFSRHMIVPKWMFDYDACEVCGVDFDSDEFLDDELVRARDDQKGDHYCFCKHCFEEANKPEVTIETISEKLESLGLSGQTFKLEKLTPKGRHCPNCKSTETVFLIGNLAGGYRCAECDTYYWWHGGKALLEDPIGYEKRNPDRFTIIEKEPEPEQKPRMFWLFGAHDDDTNVRFEEGRG